MDGYSGSYIPPWMVTVKSVLPWIVTVGVLGWLQWELCFAMDGCSESVLPWMVTVGVMFCHEWLQWWECFRKATAILEQAFIPLMYKEGYRDEPRGMCYFGCHCVWTA